MKKVSRTIGQFILLSSMALVVFSCSKDDKDSVGQETELSKTEVKTVLEIDEVSGVADNVINEVINSSLTGKTAKNENCYVADWTQSETGSGYSISFDNCKEGGETLNGTLAIAYENQEGVYAYTVTYDNLTVGDIALEGTRSFTVEAKENGAIWNITSDLSLSMGDGSVISEKGTKNISFIIGADSGMITLDGNWVVKTDGNTYTVSVPEILETQIGCEYVGRGLMKLAKNGLEVSVDFGDGSCDDLAELIYPDGTKENISLKE